MIEQWNLKNAHIFRQVFATVVSCLLSISVGLTFGFSGVLLPKLKNDPDFPYEKDLDSWIASLPPLAMVIGCIFAGAISDALGRKNGQLAITPVFVLGWIIMAFARNNIVILLGRFITGICTGATRPCSMVYIGEITSPKYRSMALVCPTLAIQIGMMISHVLGNTFHWRTSCFMFCIPNILGVIILMFLTESPLWLIEKGNTEEGLKSFYFFRGNEEAAEKELLSILQKRNEKSDKSSLTDLLRVIFSRMFMKAIVTVSFIFCAGQLSGVNMLFFYTLTLFESLFEDIIDSYTLALVIDSLTIVTVFLVCIFANIFPRRISFLVCTFVTIVLLILLSIFFFIKPTGLSWLCLSIFITYGLVANSIITLSFPFLAEIFPNKLRGFGSGLGSAISGVLLFVSVIISPGMLENLGDATMFAVYSVITLINFVVLCFILPETDGKTLQDIENSLYGNNDVQSDDQTCTTRL